MKKILYYTLAVAFIGGMASCKKDNYEEPKSKLSGRLVYQGTPIEVEYDRVPFELFQYGFGSIGPITSTFAPDGSYSHLLFNGEYKFLIRPGQGPFMWGTKTGGQQDTMTITVNGDQVMDIEVTPYYLIKNPQITGNNANVSATFDLQKVITDVNARNIEEVSLYLNKTNFVSTTDNISRKDSSLPSNHPLTGITLTASVPSITPTQNYVFGRIGVKIVGVEDRIFSSVVKISY